LGEINGSDVSEREGPIEGPIIFCLLDLVLHGWKSGPSGLRLGPGGAILRFLVACPWIAPNAKHFVSYSLNCSIKTGIGCASGRVSLILFIASFKVIPSFRIR